MSASSAAAPAVVLMLLTLALASPANATLTASGDLFLSFDGALTPTTLPRSHRAPVAVDLNATIRTLSGARPPALRAIQISLSRGGRLSAKGLPTCPRADLPATTPAEALANCGAALVGHGSYRAATAYPEQLTFPNSGHLLAFNAVSWCAAGRPAHLNPDPPDRSFVLLSDLSGRRWPSSSRTQGGRRGERTSLPGRGSEGGRSPVVLGLPEREQRTGDRLLRDPQAADRGRRDAPCHGRPEILLHVFGTDPATITRILTLHIQRRRGTFATQITGSLPASLNRYGYLTRIALHLHRTYAYRGARRSYLSAACATPPGIRTASFPFAQASMSFADGRTLSSTLTRTCRVTNP